MSEKKTVQTRLAAALHEIKNPPLSAINPHYRNKYAPLDEVLKVVKDALSKHGFYFTQTIEGDEFWTLVYDIETGDKALTACLPFPSFPDVQKLGGGITYCRRYGLLMTFGIVGEPDDDGNSAMPPKTSAATKKSGGW